MKYFLHYSHETGEVIGAPYCDVVHDMAKIPAPYIEITDAEHDDWMQHQTARKVNVETKKLVEYTPPTVELATDEKLAALDAQYQYQFKQLQQAWAAANLDGNTDLAAELQTEYQSLKQEYQTKREAIING